MNGKEGEFTRRGTKSQKSVIAGSGFFSEKHLIATYSQEITPQCPAWTKAAESIDNYGSLSMMVKQKKDAG